MSIFGDLETPAAKKPAPPAKQLVELSIKPQVQVPADERGKVMIPALQALLDPPTQTVTVRAEVKTAFSDGTAGDGVPVTFFLNGNRIGDVQTDDFGVARLDHPIPANIFTMNWKVDELTARVRGFAKEASVKVQVLSKMLTLQVSHRWGRITQRTAYRHNWRFDELELTVHVFRIDPPGFAIPTEGIVVSVERLQADGGQFETLALGTLDSTGNCTINMPNYSYDRLYAAQEKHPAELSWAEGLEVRLKDWPNEPRGISFHKIYLP